MSNMPHGRVGHISLNCDDCTELKTHDDDRPADDTDVTRKNLGQSAMNDDTLREKLKLIFTEDKGPSPSFLDGKLDAAMERGIMQEHGLTTTTREQEIAYKRQQFLQWVADEVVGKPQHCPYSHCESHTCRHWEELRDKQHQILKNHD